MGGGNGMKLFFIILLSFSLMGCDTISEEVPEVIIDLSHYSEYIVEVEAINGSIIWEWKSVDEEFCKRTDITEFKIFEVYQINKSGYDSWYHNLIEYQMRCNGSGEFNIISHNNNSEVSDNRIFYHFMWQGVVKITYNIEVSK